MSPSGKIIIAGAGVAGLTAALAFAARGFSVEIFERAGQLQEVGAGLQLSPNATRILDRLGVLPDLLPKAVRPDAIILRDAATLAELARVPLGDAGEKRWKAPYLVLHRADLQSALLARVARENTIRLVTGACVRDIAVGSGGFTASVDIDGRIDNIVGQLVVVADGVWSSFRSLTGATGKSRFSGQLAWRTTVSSDSAAGQSLSEIGSKKIVTAFLHPGFHLIAYPVRGGSAFNLAAFTAGAAIAEAWSGNADIAILMHAMRGTAPALSRLAENGAWTAWPIHTVDQNHPWTAKGGLTLIGDAAHAMTPYAAQGAAMAIEDAETLAGFAAASPGDVSGALTAWEESRRPRVQRVARRGAFNQFVWHARGPVAFARNLVLRIRPPEKLAADLDWLYGWQPPNL